MSYKQLQILSVFNRDFTVRLSTVADLIEPQKFLAQSKKVRSAGRAQYLHPPPFPELFVTLAAIGTYAGKKAIDILADLVKDWLKKKLKRSKLVRISDSYGNVVVVHKFPIVAEAKKRPIVKSKKRKVIKPKKRKN